MKRSMKRMQQRPKTSYAKGGVNRYHGQLMLLEQEMESIPDKGKSPLQMTTRSRGPRPDGMAAKYLEESIFEALTQIDMMVEMINITIIAKLQGTKYNDIEARSDLSNIRSITESLRNNWLRKKINFAPGFEDTMLNEHAAELQHLFTQLAYKPTEFLKGLNELFERRIHNK